MSAFIPRRLFAAGPRAAAAWVALVCAVPVLAAAHGQANPVDLADLANLSIEELANIQVTSVSKRPERLQDASAAVFVITADDIRRSGADSLPEVLRLAPNLHVARINGYAYSISARGMNSGPNVLSNKMLVLIDGRSVYTPLFSGVFWDAQDVVLEDIARIEVVSGPGGMMWGLNAVSGVINISTRSARDTQGSMLALHGASDGAAGAAFRQGGTSDGGVAWRAYGKVTRRSDSERVGDGRIDDGHRRALVGHARRLGARGRCVLRHRQCPPRAPRPAGAGRTGHADRPVHIWPRALGWRQPAGALAAHARRGRQRVAPGLSRSHGARIAAAVRRAPYDR